MKKNNSTLIFLAFIVSLLLTSCGHNMLVDYKVKGLDLSIPLFGYPFGIRLGEVTMNSNVLRGNSTYSAHSNTGFDVSTATTTTTNVIQFSANSQINEGYVKDILTSDMVEPDVKQTFVESYLSNQEAPVVFPVTLKTNQGTTAAGDDPELHKTEVPKHKNLLEMFSLSSWIDNILVRIGDWFVLTKAGRLIILLAKVLAGLILFLFAWDIIKKLWSLFRWLWKKIFRKKEKQD